MRLGPSSIGQSVTRHVLSWFRPERLTRDTRPSATVQIRQRLRFLGAKTPSWQLARDKMAPRFPTERTESYLQFLTTPTADTPGTTLLLHFNSKRYLIGQIAEGTQRVAQQRATRLNKLSDIFVTGPVQYATVGGLLGLLLTLADMQQAAKSSLEATKAAVLERRKQSSSNPKTGIHNVLKGGPQLYQKDTPSSVEDDLITVHGAKNLTYFMASAREFILRPSLKLRLHEIDEDAVTTLSSTVSNQITSTTATMQETVEEPGGGNPTSTQEKWPPTWRDEYIQVWAMIIPPQTLDPLGSSACPASPRKRRHAELDHDPSSSAGGNVDIKSSSSPNLRGDKIRQAIISSMFSANQNPRDKDADVQSMMTPNMSNTTTTVGQGGNPNRSTVSEESFREDINNPPDETSPAIPGLVRRPRPDPLLDSLPPTSPSSNSLSYIIKTLPQRGKFLPDRAKALKVPPGVLYRRLTSGFSVIATDGKTITPDMVLGDTKPSEGVAVLDIPAKSYVDSVVNRQEWKSKSVVEGLNTMIWILGPGVSQDSSFQAFVKSLPDVKHVISSPDHCPNYLAFESGASMAVRLHHIDPVRYPLPVHQNEPAIKNRSEGRPEAQDAPDLFVPAKRGLTMRLTTSLKTQDENSIPALDTKQVWDSVPKEALRLSRLAFESLDGSVEKNDHNSRQCDLPGKDAEIITLGTGSMMPSKYRNVSATLVRVPGVGAYLFDCGENTLGQLRRAFPAEEVNRILRELKAIWISHLHADHHLGLVPIIKARHELVWPDDVRTSFDERWNTENRNPAQASPSYEKHLFVISNSVMLRWLEHFSGVEDIGYDRIVPLHVNVPRPYVPGARSGLEWRNLQLDLSNEAEEHPMSEPHHLCNLPPGSC